MSSPPNLLTAPLETVGDWAGSLPGAARQVALWMRAACLKGVRLVSDRQPQAIRLQEQTQGRPHIWLHDEPKRTAWIVVDIGPRDWSKLAYQFGHELGHVLANSWDADASPHPPCQWLEEALVEAFTLRGLGRLADDWARDPPFPGDNAFGRAIRDYREATLGKYRSASPPGTDLPGWLTAHRAELDGATGVGLSLAPALLAALDLYEREPTSLADLGALNRWPARSALALPQYLQAWAQSCRELRAPGLLPARLRDALGA